MDKQAQQPPLVSRTPSPHSGSGGSPRPDGPPDGRWSPHKSEVMEQIRLETPITDTIPIVSRVPKRQSRSVSLEPPVHRALHSIPSFAEWVALFKRKLVFCRQIFDTDHAGAPSPAQEQKHHQLMELCEFVSLHYLHIDETCYEPIFGMFAENVLRTLPPRANPVGEEFDPEEDEPVVEASWPTLQIVYPFFIKFLESPAFSPSLARPFLNPAFICRLLPLMNSEDPRERDLLKTCLHRIYGKMLPLRSFIRSYFQQLFDEAASGEFQHSLAELLEILGSIVNGFAVPLKDEHMAFFDRHLLHLHKCRHLATFYAPLTYCLVQFVEKESALAESAIAYLLHTWPRQCSAKEVMFMNEIEELIDLAPQAALDALAARLLRRVGLCCSSLHFQVLPCGLLCQVAERALYLWNNSTFVAFLARTQNAAMPVLVPPLLHHASAHWNKNVQGLAVKALKTLLHINPELYQAATRLAPTRTHPPRPMVAAAASEGLAGVASNAGTEAPSSPRLRRKSVLPPSRDFPAD